MSVCLNYHAREFDKSHKREGKPLAKIQDGIDLVLHAILTSLLQLLEIYLRLITVQEH